MWAPVDVPKKRKEYLRDIPFQKNQIWDFENAVSYF
jgi:hypothetical protein